MKIGTFGCLLIFLATGPLDGKAIESLLGRTEIYHKSVCYWGNHRSSSVVECLTLLLGRYIPYVRFIRTQNNTKIKAKVYNKICWYEGDCFLMRTKFRRGRDEDLTAMYSSSGSVVVALNN